MLSPRPVMPRPTKSSTYSLLYAIREYLMGNGVTYYLYHLYHLPLIVITYHLPYETYFKGMKVGGFPENKHHIFGLPKFK